MFVIAVRQLADAIFGSPSESGAELTETSKDINEKGQVKDKRHSESKFCPKITGVVRDKSIEGSVEIVGKLAY
uniref:Uncharacterized protein n=1 Tax=Arion vulgaris TaxID=1028688 RepID=A0A0B6ZBN9_9EUPU